MWSSKRIKNKKKVVVRVAGLYTPVHTDLVLKEGLRQARHALQNILHHALTTAHGPQAPTPRRNPTHHAHTPTPQIKPRQQAPTLKPSAEQYVSVFHSVRLCAPHAFSVAPPVPPSTSLCTLDLWHPLDPPRPSDPTHPPTPDPQPPHPPRCN